MSNAMFKKEIAKQKGEPMNKYDGLYAFFEEEITEFREKEKEGWIQTGIQTGIYDTIFRNLQTKYGANSISKRLNEKIDEINYYPALEEIQTAVLTTPSLVAFETGGRQDRQTLRSGHSRTTSIKAPYCPHTERGEIVVAVTLFSCGDCKSRFYLKSTRRRKR